MNIKNLIINKVHKTVTMLEVNENPGRKRLHTLWRLKDISPISMIKSFGSPVEQNLGSYGEAPLEYGKILLELIIQSNHMDAAKLNSL